MHGPPGFGGPFFGPGRRAGRGDIRAAILTLLAEEPMHGYQIIQVISERSGGNWTPSPGSVYPTLQQLEDEGPDRARRRRVRPARLHPHRGGPRRRTTADDRSGAVGGGGRGGRRRPRRAPGSRPPGARRDAAGRPGGHRRPGQGRPGRAPHGAQGHLPPARRGRRRRSRATLARRLPRRAAVERRRGRLHCVTVAASPSGVGEARRARRRRPAAAGPRA